MIYVSTRVGQLLLLGLSKLGEAVNVPERKEERRLWGGDAVGTHTPGALNRVLSLCKRGCGILGAGGTEASSSAWERAPQGERLVGTFVSFWF